MEYSERAKTIVHTLLGQFPDPDIRLTPDQVETFMRPFGVISDEMETQIDLLLHGRGRSSTIMGIGAWMEANFVAAGEGPELEHRI